MPLPRRPGTRCGRPCGDRKYVIKPVDTAVNRPAGASDCPRTLLPQQTILPLVRRPQECTRPAPTAVNLSAGAFDSPARLSPQQTIVASVRIPYVLPHPAADIAVNVPSGAST